jgi:hypothetical protein
MTMRCKTAAMLTLTGLLILWGHPRAFGATVTPEEMLKRLENLSTIIQEQQKEIDRLKQELMEQRRSIKEEQAVQKDEIQKAVKAETEEAAKSWREWVPKWVERINISGDLRLRYERLWDRGMLNDDGSPAKQDPRDRGRVRLRLYVDAPITDEIDTHVMLSTNISTHQEATTSNATFTEDFNDKGIYVARAYAEYRPSWFKGLKVGAGKFKKAFYNTDIMWDPDVNPEGAYETYKYAGWDGFQPFIYLGQMVVNENSRTPDAMLYLSQAGFEWRLGPVQWMLAGSYYSWSNLAGTKWMGTGQYNSGGGNTFIADSDGTDVRYKYDYKLWEAISYVKFDLGPYPVALDFDYVRNAAQGVPSDEDSAYYASFKIGRDKKKGDYSLFYKYAYIEQNAVVGAMNDQDFYGANRKGHKVAIHYWPFENTLVRACFFYTDPVSTWQKTGNPLWNGDRYKMHEDRLQMDFIFKF